MPYDQNGYTVVIFGWSRLAFPPEVEKEGCFVFGRCAWCGIPGPVAIHHRDGNGKGFGVPNNAPSNLVPLCRECHSEAHFGPKAFRMRKRWNSRSGSFTVPGTPRRRNYQEV